VSRFFAFLVAHPVILAGFILGILGFICLLVLVVWGCRRGRLACFSKATHPKSDMTEKSKETLKSTTLSAQEPHVVDVNGAFIDQTVSFRQVSFQSDGDQIRSETINATLSEVTHKHPTDYFSGDLFETSTFRRRSTRSSESEVSVLTLGSISSNTQISELYFPKTKLKPLPLVPPESSQGGTALEERDNLSVSSISSLSQDVEQAVVVMQPETLDEDILPARTIEINKVGGQGWI
jgi:hypothetical protein